MMLRELLEERTIELEGRRTILRRSQLVFRVEVIRCIACEHWEFPRGERRFGLQRIGAHGRCAARFGTAEERCHGIIVRRSPPRAVVCAAPLPCPVHDAGNMLVDAGDVRIGFDFAQFFRRMEEQLRPEDWR